MNQQHAQGHNSVNSSYYSSLYPLALRANGSNLRIEAKIFIFVLANHSESSSSCVSPEPFVSCRRTEGTRATSWFFFQDVKIEEIHICVCQRERDFQS